MSWCFLCLTGKRDCDAELSGTLGREEMGRSFLKRQQAVVNKRPSYSILNCCTTLKFKRLNNIRSQEDLLLVIQQRIERFYAIVGHIIQWKIPGCTVQIRLALLVKRTQEREISHSPKTGGNPKKILWEAWDYHQKCWGHRCYMASETNLYIYNLKINNLRKLDMKTKFHYRNNFTRVMASRLKCQTFISFNQIFNWEYILK